MNFIRVALQAKGPRATMRRAQSLTRRYGLSPRKMGQALVHFADILRRFECGATFPITAVALARHPHVITDERLAHIEFAVHGYTHVDYTRLSPEEQIAHLDMARQIFATYGLAAEGFRSPYLRHDATLTHSLAEAGFCDYAIIPRPSSISSRCGLALRIPWQHARRAIEILRAAEHLDFHPYEVDGEKRRLVVHRKGATRSFGKGNPNVPEKYRAVGQPVLIPGDMGSASYVLVGTKVAEEWTFGSSAHGAGRMMGRREALRRLNFEEVLGELRGKGIEVMSRAKKTLVEEAPEAYKDVDIVVEITHQIGIARKVARLVPVGVVKG